MPPTMPIFERLAYHSSRRADFVHRQSHHEQHESKNDGDSDISTSIEAQEDGRALALLDGPLTWDMCHVSLSVAACDAGQG
jgi:hypothetical protein